MLKKNQETNQAPRKKSVQWNVQEKDAPENLSALAFGEEDESPLFLGRFETQEQYDAHVEIDPETGEKKKVVIFQFEPHPISRSPIGNMTTCSLEDVEIRIKAREDSNHWETLADMEWQYTFHSVETIFGLTDEKFERNPLWQKDLNHYEATMVIQALSYFLGIPTNYNADFLTNERSFIMKKAINDYAKSPYTRTEVKVEAGELWGGRKNSARTKEAYIGAKKLIYTQKIDFYQQSIQNAAKTAEEHLHKLIKTEIFA